MRTTGIGPQAPAVILALGTLLKQQAAAAIKNKHTEGPMEKSLLMGGHFLAGANGLILFIHQNNLFHIHQISRS
jgi:hypothetical protein